MSNNTEPKTENVEIKDTNSTTNVADIVTQDLCQTKAITDRMVQSTKGNIANFFHRLRCKNVESDDGDDDKNTELDSKPEPSERLRHTIENNLDQIYPKVALDVQVAALFDEYLVRETQDKIEYQYLVKHLNLIAHQAASDFNEQNEFAENEINKAKSDFENYITELVRNEGILDQDNASLLLEEVLNKIRTRAIIDLKEKTKDSQMMVDRTKRVIQDNLCVFFTNPTGKKTKEEIQAEDFVKMRFLEFKKKVEQDLLASKHVSDKIADSTKYSIEHSLEDVESGTVLSLYDLMAVKPHQYIKEIGQRFSEDVKIIRTSSNLEERTKEELMRVSEAMQEGVSLLKSGIETNIINQSTNNRVQSMDAMIASTAEKDFEETDKRVKDDLEKLKIKVSESTKSVNSLITKE